MRRLPALLLLPLVMFLASGCSESEDAAGDETTVPTTDVGTTTAPTSTTAAIAESTEVSTSAGIDPNIPLAKEIIALWSANHTEAFWGHFNAAALFDGYPAHEPPTQSYFGFYMGLHDTVTVTGCSTSSVPDRVTCRTRHIDELSGPVGVGFEGDWIFDFADGQVVALNLYDDDPSKIIFVEAMASWVRDEHPEIWASVFVDPDCSHARVDCYAAWAASPATAEAMLQLGPEYRASLDS